MLYRRSSEVYFELERREWARSLSQNNQCVLVLVSRSRPISDLINYHESYVQPDASSNEPGKIAFTSNSDFFHFWSSARVLEPAATIYHPTCPTVSSSLALWRITMSIYMTRVSNESESAPRYRLILTFHNTCFFFCEKCIREYWRKDCYMWNCIHSLAY